MPIDNEGLSFLVDRYLFGKTLIKEKARFKEKLLQIFDNELNSIRFENRNHVFIYKRVFWPSTEKLKGEKLKPHNSRKSSSVFWEEKKIPKRKRMKGKRQ